MPRGASAELAPSARLDFELEVGILSGRETARLADPGGAGRGACVRPLPPQRLVGARPAGLGISAAGALPRQELRDHDLALGGDLEALAPYRLPWSRPAEDPQPLPYLDSAALRASGALDMHLEVALETAAMRAAGAAPQPLARTNFRHSYWSLAQMVAHHTVNGCNLEPGDLLGSGTQSGPTPDQAGSLLELSEGGKRALLLASGETRTFLEDGDRVILRGWCERPGCARIGFGEASGTVLSAD